MKIFIGGIQIDVNEYVQELEVEFPTERSAWGRVVFFDKSWSTMEDFLLRQGHSTPVILQFGFNGAFSDPLEFKLGRYTPSFTHAGVILDVELMDGATVANLLARSKGYPLSKYPRISDIILEICTRNRWKAVVEPTKKLVKPMLAQSNIPDNQYAALVLQEQAVNNEGNGGYKCYMEPPDIFHFHTPAYVLQTKNAVYRTYNYAKELDGEVIEFTPEDHAVELAQLGARDAVYECLDPRTGERSSIRRTSKGTGKAKLVGPGEIDPIVHGDGINRFLRRPFENPEELKRYAEQRWAMFNQLQFTATLKLLGDPFIKPMRYVVVNVIKEDGNVHERWSGKYLIKKITHNLAPGSFTTTCELQRETVGTGTVEADGKKVSVRQGETEQQAYTRALAATVEVGVETVT